MMIMMALPVWAPPHTSIPLAVVRVNSSMFLRVPGPADLELTVATISGSGRTPGQAIRVQRASGDLAEQGVVGGVLEEFAAEQVAPRATPRFEGRDEQVGEVTHVGVTEAAFRHEDAARTAALAESSGLSVEVWDEQRLEAEGCRAMLAVGAGSARKPRLV